jgi:hypothetical protein
MGIINPTSLAPTQHQASLDITQPLSDAIIEQKPYNHEVTAKQQLAKEKENCYYSKDISYIPPIY